ncbi:hypothetical protein [Oscillibacter sp.]|uniref:hypothetical protein n=1 Tax=Oscillibacter sp. TaxID=1945593 RepID=UPI00289B807F|nr:hypothetical protein [Oscillibacter sp.]
MKTAATTSAAIPNPDMKSRRSAFFLAFSVGSVLFSAHAGGGFATGNQANTYYVGLGWLGPVAAILAVLLMSLTMREAMFFYNSRNLKSYKELFEAIFSPFKKIEWLFEVFFYIMVVMAIAAAISGAASALNAYFGIPYALSVLAVGALVLTLTIFGANLVRLASTYMGMAILVIAISIYAIGITKGENIATVLSASFQNTGFSMFPKAILNAFVYAGFQCVTLPTMLACGKPLSDKRGCNKSMNIAFVMNAAALTLSVFMLLSWQGFYTAAEGGTVIPTLTVCREIGIPWLTVAYGACLLLCLISTGVTTTFGFVAKFENVSVFKGIENPALKNGIIAASIIAISMGISFAGLTNIIKYGYGYCGYLGIAVVIVPMLTMGVYKNRQFLAANPGYKG